MTDPYMDTTFTLSSPDSSYSLFYLLIDLKKKKKSEELHAGLKITMQPKNEFEIQIFLPPPPMGWAY